MITNEIETSMKFSSDAANSYASSVAEKQKDIAEKQKDIAKEKANRLIKYIESKYEKKIKKAIMKKIGSSYVDISLPYFSKIKNEDVYSKVANIVEDHFRNLGFRTSMTMGDSCNCPFDILCNYRDGFNIRLYWR